MDSPGCSVAERGTRQAPVPPTDPAAPRSVRSAWMIAVVSMIGLALTVAIVWLSVFPLYKAPSFIDLDSYRRTLDGVVAGDLMYKWLGYPPVTLIVLSPLRGLPELAGDRLWTGGSIALALALAAALTSLTVERGIRRPESATPRRLTRFSVIGALLLLSFPMTNQLATGQITLLVVTLAFLDASGVLRRCWQGALVGVAASLKLLPLMFFPYYLLTKQWRAFAVAVGSFAAFTAVGFALFPVDSAYFWTHLNSSGRLGVDRAENVSLFGVASRWISDPSVAFWVWLPVVALVAGFGLFRARQHFFRGEQVQAALVIGCIATVVSPIAWPHYQLWLVLTAIWLIFSGVRNGRVLGLLLYLAYSLPVIYLLYGLRDASMAARIGWELPVIVPAVIAVFGLPRDHERPTIESEDAR